MAKKQFRFKQGTKVEDEKAKLEELSKAIDAKLAKLQGEEDEDFAMLELEDKKEAKPTKAKSSKPKLPKLKPTKVLIKEKRLVLEDEERTEFDAFLLQFNQARTEHNKLGKEVAKGREHIYGVMGDNLVYEGDDAKLKISETKNESINAETVIEALVDLESEDMDEIKDGVQRLMDLARLGIVSIGKTDFDRWAKSQGYDTEPFIVKRAPKKRITISKKD